MNLQESIRKILREEKDHTKLIKGIIDSSDIFDYKHFCGFDIITPEERIDKHNFLHKNKIPYLIKVYFVGGVNSEVWPRTQAIHRKESDLMDELLEYIKSFVPFNIEMWRAYVNTCDGYDKLMKRKHTTDDLQESIRKILREELNKPSESEFIQAIKDVKSVIPIISHRIIEEEGLEHNEENMVRLNKIILQKVIEGDDEILDEMWNLAGSRVIKHAINIITYYTK